MLSDAPRRMQSIGARLTLFYTLVALVAMALFATAVIWKLSVDLNTDHLRFLQAKTAEMQTDLNEGHGQPAALLGEIDKETSESRIREYQARVLTGDGRPLGETPGMGAALPIKVFSATNSSATDASKQQVGDHIYALTTVSLHTLDQTAPLHVQIALDITRDDHLLSELRRTMWLAFALLAPLLALAGRWVSARGLAPLARIANAAREVIPTHLSARIPTTPPWPDELSELVQVFNAMLTRLDEAFARLSRFSADLAHELRTPLSNMSSALEVCLLSPRDTPEYREALESNLEECRRLGALIDNLLFMARAERAEHALRPENFDGVEVCTWVIAQQAISAQTHGIQIELTGHAHITADPVLFRQALVNVLANAIQHSKTAGSVQIALRSNTQGAVEVRVVDHGVGIHCEHLPNLFDRFYQADPSRTRDGGQGTGLGLAIVKTIVDLHGGSVEIDSTPGAGTTVFLRFPAHSAECAQDAVS